MPKWWITMADREGVGLNRLQFTTAAAGGDAAAAEGKRSE
jgi:hypothetical protein